MGDLIPLRQHYRHEIKPATVQKVNGHYEPEMNWLWTETSRLAWLLGVLNLNSGVTVRLFRQSKTGGRFELRFGPETAMEDLKESQVWDALTAANEVAVLIRKAD